MDRRTHAIFSPIKQEVDNIGYHVMAFYPYIDKFVWADGGSTDGTVELLKYIKERYDPDNKIVLFENMDCDVYGQSYVDLYNFLLKECKTDLVSFIHPDMIPINPEILTKFDEDRESLRWNSNLVSFTGDRNHIWKGKTGRAEKWVITSVNDFGLHYFGYYGDLREDLYFSDITGDEHIPPAAKGNTLPYKIGDTGLTLYHYCDAKPYERRIEKMLSVMKNHANNSFIPENTKIEEQAKKHPRVTCESGQWADIYGNPMIFEKVEFEGKIPDVFEKYKEFEGFKK